MVKLSVGTRIHLPTLLVIPSQPSSFLHQLILIAGVTKQVPITKDGVTEQSSFRWGGDKKMFVICLSESAEVLMQGLEYCITHVTAELQRSQTLTQLRSSPPLYSLCHTFTLSLFHFCCLLPFASLFSALLPQLFHCMPSFSLNFFLALFQLNDTGEVFILTVIHL